MKKNIKEKHWDDLTEVEKKEIVKEEAEKANKEGIICAWMMGPEKQKEKFKIAYENGWVDEEAPIKKGYVDISDFWDPHNPDRNISKVNPNDELAPKKMKALKGKLKYKSEGYRMIETSVLRKFYRAGLSGCEMSIFLFILDNTRGFRKPGIWETEGIYFTQSKLVEVVGKSKGYINKSLRSLIEKHLIYPYIDEKDGLLKYGINFRHDTWQI